MLLFKILVEKVLQTIDYTIEHCNIGEAFFNALCPHLRCFYSNDKNVLIFETVYSSINVKVESFV